MVKPGLVSRSVYVTRVRYTINKDLSEVIVWKVSEVRPDISPPQRFPVGFQRGIDIGGLRNRKVNARGSLGSVFFVSPEAFAEERETGYKGGIPHRLHSDWALQHCHTAVYTDVTTGTYHRRVATCESGKSGLASFSETQALFFIQFVSFRKMKVQARQNGPSKSYYAKAVKNYMRSTMRAETLSDLAVLYA